MNKSTKKILFASLGLLCAAAAIVIVYYMITQGKIGSPRADKSPSELQQLLEKDLETKYPGTPTEVVKLYWRYNKYVYNNSVEDKDFEGLLKQMRMLYDEEMLAVEENSFETMLANLKKDTQAYQKDGQVISTCSVQQNSTVQYNTIDGKECATVITGTGLKKKNERKQTYEKFLCRKNNKGEWHIVGWQQTTDKNDIATLGEK